MFLLMITNSPQTLACRPHDSPVSKQFPADHPFGELHPEVLADKLNLPHDRLFAVLCQILVGFGKMMIAKKTAGCR